MFKNALQVSLFTIKKCTSYFHKNWRKVTTNTDRDYCMYVCRYVCGGHYLVLKVQVNSLVYSYSCMSQL